MRAANAAQTAYSVSDWELVERRWQTAINFLNAIPESSDQYPTAQAKIAEYQGYAAIAQQRQTDLKTAVNSAPRPSETASQTTTASASTHPLCRGRIARTSDVVLSNFQFQRDEFTEGEDYLVGCVTNWGDRPVMINSLSYSTQSETSAGGGITSLDMPNTTLQPGESAPWRSGFTFDENDALITLASLYISWEGGEAEEIELNIEINH